MLLDILHRAVLRTQNNSVSNVTSAEKLCLVGRGMQRGFPFPFPLNIKKGCHGKSNRTKLSESGRQDG